jgi:PST family polysaccharide transporter
MKLARTAFFSTIITFFRIGSNFVIGKIVALLTGAAGVATVGAFMNFITIAYTLATGAISNGVIKYTAEFKDNEIISRALFSTAARISLFFSGLFGIIIILCSNYISKILFYTEEFRAPIIAFGVTVFLYSLNTMLLSILNGQGKIKDYTLINSFGSAFILFLSCFLIYFFRVEGALFALATGQALVFFITIFFVIKHQLLVFSDFNDKFSKEWAKKLGSFSIMAIVSAITMPSIQIFIRNYLTSSLSLEQAGYWQAMMRISDGYLLVIVTALNTYYLPKLSEIKENKLIRKEVLYGYKMILPVVLLSCILIYVLRSYIIILLFSRDFLEIGDILIWQLFGDFFKIAAWILSYILISKARIKIYVFSELFFSLTYLCLCFFLIRHFGLEGTSLAFCINMILYLIFMLFVLRKMLFYKREL